ncbi:hypothetical protein SBX64_15860 [Vibrio rhizosphaerae]|uniref:Uncharacterized protein n=1 Tax=Vibrio rhizosphaerae TaxID=398736 RepID=A0ABU4IX90_9VIBR|nr:hypothetical protein [Vibrio rhizosphaerae]MDW6094014.1 hypothetical protein [Vibrio rhizosphaerae]
MLRPVEAIRENGFFSHPELPCWDEGVDTSVIHQWFDENNLTLHLVMMDGDADQVFVDSWYEDGLDDCSPWTPTPPNEDAILLTIYDTEDGPCAWFGIPKEAIQA